MTLTIVRSVLGAAVLLVLGTAGLSAQAASVRVRCDVFPDRSRASVDGRDLPAGDYTAMLTSGPHAAQSVAQGAVGGEAGFDFDSNRKDVAQGATKIGKHFIVDDSVTGSIVDANGNTVATETRRCRTH